MGPLTNLLAMVPGFSGAQLQNLWVDDRELDRVQAIILSMTPDERRRPELIKGSRRLRIARGSGTSVQQVNRLVKQFGQMRKVLRQAGHAKPPGVGAATHHGR
jgi:signal recognition particle subunit SRP54